MRNLKMDPSSDVNKNATYNIIKNIFSIIFPLITFPYISRVLGAENVGKVNFSLSVVSYFSLIASLGVGTYAIRECAGVRGDRERLSKVSSQIFSINVLSSGVAYVLLFLALLVAEPLDSYRQLILIQSISMVLTTVGADWLNTAMGDFKYITTRTVLMQLVSLATTLLLVRESPDYYIYAWISVLAAGGANVFNIIYRERYCRTRFTFQMDMARHLPPIMLLFSMVIAQTIFVNTDTTILGLVKGDFEVGLYGVSTKIYNMVNQVIASVAWVVMPQMSELFVSKNYKEINSLLRYSLNFIVVLGVPAVVGLNVLAREIILVMAGNEYAGAEMSLHILTVSLAFSFAGGFIGNIILLPSRRENIMLVGSIVSAIVNLVLNLVLIPRFGLNAAAATTAAANGIGFLIGIPFIEKSIKITGLWRMLRAPVIAGIILYISVELIKSIGLNLYFTTIFSIIVGALLYLIVLILLKDEFALRYMGQIREKTAVKKQKG